MFCAMWLTFEIGFSALFFCLTVVKSNRVRKNHWFSENKQPNPFIPSWFPLFPPLDSVIGSFTVE